jgi:chemotaxis protein CheD
MIIQVRMGEGVVMESPHIIKSVGLGSCAAVTLYDTRRRIGGLAHIMLPEAIKREDEKMKRQKLRRCEDEKNLNFSTSDFLHLSSSTYQYADTAIPALLEVMRKRGTDIQDIVAKAVGGARMFSHYEGLGAGIGEQNIMSVRELLKKKRIPLIREDTGGNHGRSVEFYLYSGRVVIKAVEKEDREI